MELDPKSWRHRTLTQQCRTGPPRRRIGAAPRLTSTKSPVLTGRASPESRVSRRQTEDLTVGGVRWVTSEMDEPVEVGLDEFCKMLNDGNTCVDRWFC